MDCINSLKKEGYIKMGDKAKFWFTLIVPVLVSMLMTIAAWLVTYGALSQEVRELKKDVQSLESTFGAYTENVRRLGEIVAANTRELQVRFGGTNAKLFYYEGADSSLYLRPNWGTLKSFNEPQNNRNDEQTEGVVRSTNDCELSEEGEGCEWLSGEEVPALFTNQPTLFWGSNRLSM